MSTPPHHNSSQPPRSSQPPHSSQPLHSSQPPQGMPSSECVQQQPNINLPTHVQAPYARQIPFNVQPPMPQPAQWVSQRQSTMQQHPMPANSPTVFPPAGSPVFGGDSAAASAGAYVSNTAGSAAENLANPKKLKKAARKAEREAKKLEKRNKSSNTTGINDENNGASAEDTAKEKSKAKKSYLKLTVAAVLIGALVFVGAGMVAGWYLNDYITAGGETEFNLSDTQGAAVIGNMSENPMPDIRGRDIVQAKQILADSGFDVNAISVTELPWGGAAGVVVSQNPVVGETVTGAIKLEVSAAAQVPNVVGMDVDEAVTQLRNLGVDPQIEEDYALDKPTNSVLSVVPAVGESLPEHVVLQVAQAGSSLYFSEISMADSICSSTKAAVNAKQYPNSLSCNSGSTNRPSEGMWLINRNVRAISGIVGVPDDGEANATVQVKVIGDGRELGTFNANYANPAEVNINTEGVLRLEIYVVSETGSRAILGDWIAKGTSDEISALEALQ